MALTWTPPQQADYWDGYLDWTRLMQERREALLPPDPGGHLWFEPIFVRLHPGADGIEAARAYLMGLVDDPNAPFIMDAQEYARLSARVADPSVRAGLPDEYALYRKLGTPQAPYDARFDLLDVGAMLDLDADLSQMTGTLPDPPEMKTKPTKGAPIVAIMDDGIGFLNARFRRKCGSGYTTRFHALWLQSLEKTRGLAPRRAVVGTVLKTEEIDAWLSDLPRMDESAVYARLNQRLFPQEGHRTTDFGQSHGTVVLDLAAGADPDAGDPVSDWPLLGVQLPPQAVADTSGTQFESYMVQGIRWILAQAAQIDPDAPVIVNISLGMLAGPKDGTRFTEYQISQEAQNWQAVTGQPVRVVWSFGNNRLSRQVAQFDFDATGPSEARDQQIIWRSQPDDLTPSFMEVRSASATEAQDLEVALIAPDGTSSGFAAMQPGEYRSLEAKGQAIARLYLNPEHALAPGVTQRPFYLLALAPTNAMLAGEALAPSGGWTVAVRYKGAAAAQVHLQIQRGDSLPSYAPRGRQSYFDSPDAYAWDPELQNYWGLAPDCPISHAGTHNALVTAVTRQIFSVGAAEWHPEAAAYRAPVYTAVGADWSVPTPTAATQADDSRIHWGVLASGTISGSVFALDGTSAAAGRLTRALGLSAARIVVNSKAGGGTQMDDFDTNRLTVRPVDAKVAPQLGAAIVTRQGGTRARNP